jgi:CRP/FNR family transcriptional regulator
MQAVVAVPLSPSFTRRRESTVASPSFPRTRESNDASLSFPRRQESTVRGANVRPWIPAVAGTARSPSCTSCALRGLCLPCGLPQEDLDRIDALVYTRRRVRRGESLYRAGDAFHALYAFRTGFFKSCTQTADGRNHVTGFQMAGDLAGLDGIVDGTHTVDVIALEDGEACVIPYAQLEELASRVPALQQQLLRLMSGEIVRRQEMMMLLATMRAEARVAAFLLDLSQRFSARGYSPAEFNLRMTREEIGSYLGLKLETVSRTLSRFQARAIISATNRHIRIHDTAALRALGTEPQEQDVGARAAAPAQVRRLPAHAPKLSPAGLTMAAA